MAGNKACGVNYFCLGAVLIFLGSVLLCSLGFTVMLPYTATKDWPQTVCHVFNSSYNPSVCACEQQPLSPQEQSCLGHYPCLVIAVLYRKAPSTVALNNSSFPTSEIDGAVRNASIEVLVDSDGVRFYGAEQVAKAKDASVVSFNATQMTTSSRVPRSRDMLTRLEIDRWDALSPSTGWNDMSVMVNVTTNAIRRSLTSASMFRSWTDAFYKKCALQECGDEEWNIRQAERFKTTYGVAGDTFACYYDPTDPATAILTRVGWTMMIHALFWPCLALFLGIGLWLGLCLGLWKMKSDGA